MNVDESDPVDRLLPEPDFRRWVGDQLPGDGPFTVVRVTSGLSNELFRISRSGWSAVVRRPPRVGHPAVSELSLAREHRVLSALAESGVPHPRPLLLCLDVDVIGAPFLVLEEITGVRLYDALPPAYQPTEVRRSIGFSLVDCLVELHAIDWKAVGLGDFGRPENFVERQVDRWSRQLVSFQTREFPGLEATVERLRVSMPAGGGAAVLHGDFGLHNVLFPIEPGPVAAVLDWETSSLGDPLMDLAYFTSMWLDPVESKRWFASALPYETTGFARQVELVDHYATRTGRDLSGLRWFQAVAQLKMAAMLEGAYARYVAGEADVDNLDKLGDDVLNHLDHATFLAFEPG